MGFSEEAAEWDAQPHRAERAAQVATAIRDALPLRRDMTVIELGGGTGLLSRALADDVGPVTVTDEAEGMVEAAAKVLDDPAYAGWQAMRLDIEHDPLPVERYDLAVSLLALHHMGDVASVIRRTFDLLQPGGLVALVDLDTDDDGAFHAHRPDFDGHHGFGRDQVATWLTEAGFDEVHLSTAYEETGHEDSDRAFPCFLATGRRPG